VLAHETVRITAEPRTNAVIVSATDENMKIIEDLILRLDDKAAGAIKLKIYPLRYADATSAAKLVADLFVETSSASQAQRSRGGRGGNPFVPVWAGGQGGEAGESLNEVRAVPDIRTNSVLVAASEQNLVLVDGIMLELDRPVNDILEVKIYRLQNADPAQMATVLQALFRPQVTATQNAGRSSGGQQGQGGNWFQRLQTPGAAGPASLLPSQEVEIAADTRTRSVIVKASREYIAVMDDVIKQLDADPTEAVSTYVVPLRNADAVSLAATLQGLLRGTGSSLSQRNQGQQGQNQGLFSGMQALQNNRGQGGQQGNTRGNNRGGSGTRGRNLGPLEADPQDLQEPMTPEQEEEQRRAVEGQVDVEADPTTNSIILRTSPRNFESIQSMLQDLDRMRPQVLIKVLIADVALDERTQFGLEGFWENQMTVRGGDLATNRFTTDFTLATQGFTYLLTGDEFQATMNLFAQEGKLKVLATPRILVLDNQAATINVGKEVPRITNSQVNQLGNTINSVTYENVGIMLEVVPHINPDGLVIMEVAPEISDVASAAESVQIAPGVNNPTFNVNSARTRVAVRSGTTVVIGGLIRDTVDDSVQKVPLLGDIPVLGYLFSNTTLKKVKRELMIFLTPYVAFTAAELEELTELEKSRLRLIDPRDVEAESDRWLERVRP
jgi:general secretion pathway protein D